MISHGKSTERPPSVVMQAALMNGASVTGAGRGIGAAIATRSSREGAAVLIAEKNAISGMAAAADLEAKGADAIFVEADATALKAR
jgi:NAD(P)-dependent dehydrogenase (short-subunit alcohol dehydrogenase family)